MSASVEVGPSPSLANHRPTANDSMTQNSDFAQPEVNGSGNEDSKENNSLSEKAKVKAEMRYDEDFKINNTFPEKAQQSVEANGCFQNLSKSVELTKGGFESDKDHTLEKGSSDRVTSLDRIPDLVQNSRDWDPDTCVSLPADFVANGNADLQDGCQATSDEKSNSASLQSVSLSTKENLANSGIKPKSSQSEDCIVRLRNSSGREILGGHMSQSYTRLVSGAFEFLKDISDTGTGPNEKERVGDLQGINGSEGHINPSDVPENICAPHSGTRTSKQSPLRSLSENDCPSNITKPGNMCNSAVTSCSHSDIMSGSDVPEGNVPVNGKNSDKVPDSDSQIGHPNAAGSKQNHTASISETSSSDNTNNVVCVSESSSQVPDKGETCNSETAASAEESDSTPVMRKRSSKRRDNSLKTADSTEQEDSEDSSDEDSGVYAESHRNSHWIKVEDDGTLTLPGMPYTIEEDVDQALSAVDGGISPEISSSDRASKNDDVFSEAVEDYSKTHKRTDSCTTTASESEFRNKFRFLRKRSVQRHNSHQQFYRMSTKYYEDEMTIRMEKDNGHINFGLHILDSHPAVISAVVPGSAAEKSGVQAGQILISVNGVNVLAASHAEIIRLIQQNLEALTVAVGQSDVWHSRDLQAPVLSGYLFKQGSSGLIKLWRKRWFVLRQDNCLYYYKTENDNDPLGAVPLTDYSISKAIEINRDFPFKLEKFSARTYYLAAESDEARKTWATAMTAAARSTLKTESWMDVTSHNVGIPALSIRKPECSGYLSKMGESRKVWRKRYCVLKDACIYYYKGINSYSAQGVAHLHGYQVDRDVGSNKKQSFKLIPPEPNMRTFWFCTENATDRERWIGTMEKSISRWKRISSSN